jgi:hypothetical protein
MYEGKSMNGKTYLLVICIILTVIIRGESALAKSSLNGKEGQKMDSVSDKVLGSLSEALRADKEIMFNSQWAERVSLKNSEPLAPMNLLKLIHEDSPGDTKINRCAAGGPLRIGEKIYKHGIGVNSHSVMKVSLIQPAKRFVADIGLDRNVDNTIASVRFHVSIDGQDAFKTEVMRPSDGMRYR